MLYLFAQYSLMRKKEFIFHVLHRYHISFFSLSVNWHIIFFQLYKKQNVQYFKCLQELCSLCLHICDDEGLRLEGKKEYSWNHMKGDFAPDA